MRIADILSRALDEGTSGIVDTSRPSAELDRYLGLTPELRAIYRRAELASLIQRQNWPEGTVVLVTLGSGDDRELVELEGAVTRSPVGSRWIVLLGEPARHGGPLVEALSSARVELTGVTTTNHRALPCAAIGRRVEGLSGGDVPRGERTTVKRQLEEALGPEGAAELEERGIFERTEPYALFLRMKNEYLFDRFERQSLVRERDVLRQDLEVVTHAALRIEADLLETEKRYGELQHASQRYERTKASLSYRLGQAQVLAVKKPGWNTLALFPRVVAAFRTRDEKPPFQQPATPRPKLSGLGARRPSIGALVRPSEIAALDLEGDVLLGDYPLPEPGYAAFVGSRALAEEIGSAAPLAALSPHSWKALLARTEPGFVLFEGGLADRHGPWALVGDRPYADLEARLRRLIVWCADQGIPTVLWDGGRTAPVFFEVASAFSAVLSSDDRALACFRAAGVPPQRLEVMAPGLSPRRYHPFGDRRPDDKVAFVGDNDQSQPIEELAVRRQVWTAAGDRLALYDDYWREPGSRRSFPPPLLPKIMGRVHASADWELYARHRIYVFGAYGPDRRGDHRAIHALASGARVAVTSALGLEPFRAWLEVLEHTDDVRGVLERSAEPLSVAAHRTLFAEHAWWARLQTVAERLGRSSVPFSGPRPLVRARVETPSDLERLTAQLVRQSVRPKGLVLEGAAVPSDRSTHVLAMLGCPIVKEAPPGAVEMNWPIEHEPDLFTLQDETHRRYVEMKP